MSSDGTLEHHDGKDVLRFERRLEHPVERVWSALTDPGQLSAWWGDADLELVEGGRFVVRWRNTDDEGNRSVMTATVTRLEPPTLLETEVAHRPELHGKPQTVDVAAAARDLTLVIVAEAKAAGELVSRELA